MADTTLEYIEQLVDQLSQEDQHQLVENLTQRLRRSSKEDTLRPYGLCHGDFVVPDDFDVCDTKF